MVELMLMLVVFSLILASSFAVITRRHKLKPAKTLHGEYLCYYGDLNGIKSDDGSKTFTSDDGQGNIEIYYQGSSELKRNATGNGGKDACKFKLPANSTYFLVRMAGGGGAGGNANYAPDVEGETVSTTDTGDIVVNLIKGVVENNEAVGGGAVRAYQPIFDNKNAYSDIKDNNMYKWTNIQKYGTGVDPDYVEKKFTYDDQKLVSKEDFIPLVNYFFNGLKVYAYDYGGSGQSGVKMANLRNLLPRSCKNPQYRDNILDCFKDYLKTQDLMEEPGANSFSFKKAKESCVPAYPNICEGKAGIQDFEDAIAQYCPDFFNDYWVHLQDQDTFYTCNSQDGGKGAMFRSAPISENSVYGFRYNMSTLVADRIGYDKANQPVYTDKKDRAPAPKIGDSGTDLVTKASFESCDPSISETCKSFDIIRGQGIVSENYEEDCTIAGYCVPKNETPASYNFSDYEYPDLYKIESTDDDHSPILRETNTQFRKAEPGKIPYSKMRKDGKSTDENYYSLRLFYLQLDNSTQDRNSLAYSKVSSIDVNGHGGMNMNHELKNFWNPPNSAYESGKVKKNSSGAPVCDSTVKGTHATDGTPKDCSDSTCTDMTDNDLNNALCIANLMFVSDTLTSSQLRGNLGLGNDAFACSLLIDPNNQYRNQGFYEKPIPYMLKEDQFAIKYKRIYNNKTMTYGLAGNPGEYKEFYTRANTANQIEIIPGRGGQPNDMLKKEDFDSATNKSDFFKQYKYQNPHESTDDNIGGDGEATRILFNPGVKTEKSEDGTDVEKTYYKTYSAAGGKGGRSGLLEKADNLVYSSSSGPMVYDRLVTNKLTFPRYSRNTLSAKIEGILVQLKAILSYIFDESTRESFYNDETAIGAKTKFETISSLINIRDLDDIVPNFGKGGDAGYGWDNCWVGVNLPLVYRPNGETGTDKAFAEHNLDTKVSPDYKVYNKGNQMITESNINSSCKQANWWGNEPGEAGTGGAVLITW